MITSAMTYTGYSSPLSIRSIRSTLILLLIGCCLLLAGCGGHRAVHDGPPLHDNIDPNSVPDAIPKAEPYSKYGNPHHYTVKGRRYYIMKNCDNYHERGIASWYGTLFHKHRTSSGEPYDMFKMTAAHKTLPIPSYARVTNMRNGKVVIVKINDRGPFAENRIMDLSYIAAKKLGFMGKGTGLVDVELLKPGNYKLNTQPTHNVVYKTPAARPQIYLQVGVFRNLQNAKNMQAKVQPLSAYPVMIRKKTNVIFKVVIGPIDRVEDSDRVTKHLKAHQIKTTAMSID